MAAEMTYATVAVRVMVHGEGARVRTAPVPAAMLALLELLAAAAVLVAAGLPVAAAVAAVERVRGCWTNERWRR